MPSNKKILWAIKPFTIFTATRDMAYCCSGLGIIAVDENKYEVKDTYTIGNSGNTVKVNGLATDAVFFTRPQMKV